MGDWVADPFMRRPHAIIFVFPANQHGIPDSLIKFVDTVRQQGNPVTFSATQTTLETHDVGGVRLWSYSGMAQAMNPCLL